MMFYLRAILLVSLSVAFTAGQSQSDDVIRVETNLVSVPVIVRDRDGRYVGGLKQSDFSLSVNGKPQEIAFFASQSEPFRVAILIDTSRSTEQILGKIKKAAREFIRILGPADSAMIVTFDSELRTVAALSNDKIELDKAVRDIRIGEFAGTVLRDALFETISKPLARVSGRKAVILFTDGKDFGSYVYQDELLVLLEESDAMVYPIFYETKLPMPTRIRARRDPGIGRNFPRGQRNEERMRRRQERENERARELLESIAALTAGRLFDKKDEDLDDIFRSIATELRQQYRLGFYPGPELSETSAALPIKVKTNKTGVSVQARGSFRLKK